MTGNALRTELFSKVARIAIYSRYSSDNQRDASIADQNRDCAAEIARQGLPAGTVFSDRALSGSSAHRPQYQALLDGIQRGQFDVVVAESLDRLSRDQEDLAALYKRCQFAGIRIFTLAEGWINELHVGLKGTMSALFLKDLADKTRRGLRGRIEAGASAGGISYGCAVVRVPEGEDRGARTIDQVQADVVRRIFRDYADGLSPKAIAAALNRDGLPSPRGEGWSQSTINGNRRRGTGVLNNGLYAGFLVWNRLRYVKDPDTGRRRSRPNREADLVVVEVRQLRIVDAALWDRVRARQAALDAAARPAVDGSRFQSMQRPKRLLSELLRCGACGGGFSMISATHLGCSNARNKGGAVCSNRRTIRCEAVEGAVLDALATRLMMPEVYASFLRGFMAEWNREQGERAAGQNAGRAEVRRLEKSIVHYVRAVGESGGSPGILSALREAEVRKAALEAELAAAEAPAPRLHPNLPELYCGKVMALRDALGDEDAGEARERVRALIAEVRLVPVPRDAKARLAIAVRGELAALLALGSGQDASAVLQLEKQFKLVAGAGFEPAAFRL